MPAPDPIILGAPNVSSFIFETGSNITTSTSGIQECSVKALCARGSTVFSLLPAAGASFNTVFGNGYLPSTFLVDYSTSGPQVEYLEGQCVRVTFSFKRPDPTQTGSASRKIFVDSVINYESPLNQNSLTFFTLGGSTSTTSFGPFGFPEPVVTVKYNSATRPGIGSGSLAQLYALPGSTNAQGFPDTPIISNALSIPVPAGATVTYYNGSEFVSAGPLSVITTFNFSNQYKPNALGWQLIRLKSDPIASSAFFDCEEEWRTYYFFYQSTLVGTVPPV